MYVDQVRYKLFSGARLSIQIYYVYSDYQFSVWIFFFIPLVNNFLIVT